MEWSGVGSDRNCLDSCLSPSGDPTRVVPFKGARIECLYTSHRMARSVCCTLPQHYSVEPQQRLAFIIITIIIVVARSQNSPMFANQSRLKQQISTVTNETSHYTNW